MAKWGRKRIGLLTPGGNTTMEDDFMRWMPSSVSLHVNRVEGRRGDSDWPSDLLQSLQELGENVEEPARVLATASVDVIAFGCTGASFLNGWGYDQVVSDRIEAASGGIKAKVAAGAVVEALNELGVRRIAACSPYPDALNERLHSFYTDAGFDIVSFDDTDKLGQNPDDDEDARRLVFDLASSVDRPEAEAIFISCTAFQGAGEIIEELEEATGKPVVTSNQASLWACLKAMDVSEPVEGAGQLLKERVPA